MLKNKYDLSNTRMTNTWSNVIFIIQFYRNRRVFIFTMSEWSCIDVVNGYLCNCTGGYEGLNCETGKTSSSMAL